MGAVTKAVGRSDVHFFRPEDLTLVTDPAHPLYDPRVDNPVDPGIVKNVMAHGIIEPVVVRRNGDAFEVVAGRQRVKWARAANEILTKDGREPVAVPCRVDRSNEANQMGILIAENECRSDDNPTVKLEKVRRYLAMGRTEEQAATAFGRPVSYVRQLLRLGDCAPKVQAAVAAGKLGLTAAAKLSALPRDEQVAKLGTLGEAPTVADVTRSVKAAKGETTGPRPPSRKEVRKRLEERRATDPVYAAALQWVLTGE